MLAAASDPKITSSEFESMPTTLFYFKGSQTILFQDTHLNVLWRSTDGGGEWNKIDGIDGQGSVLMLQHPYHHERAYLLSESTTHFKTEDRGQTWTEFLTSGYRSRYSEDSLTFHAKDHDKIIFNALECEDIENLRICSKMSLFTVDGFESTKPLRKNTRDCYFAKSTPAFTTGNEKTDDKRIICVAMGKHSKWQKDYRLLISDDFFETEDEPAMDNGRTVPGIVNMFAVKKFLIVGAKAHGATEMSLYVSRDGDRFKRAIFSHEHTIEERAYTVLESTNYSVQLDVQTSLSARPMGALFSSNSEGNEYTELLENTYRSREGFVDFEKIQGIDGILLVNVVKNHKEVESDPFFHKAEVISRISFDDGRNFNDLQAGEKDRLNLHSVTDMTNSGRIFSSPAPGLVMGIGNTGDRLLPYDEGDLYVSDNAGKNWKKALDGAHKYEFGDQGSILVAVYDEEPTDVLRYSINHGTTWEKVKLKQKIDARLLTTSPDSASMKFLLIGSYRTESQRKHWSFSIDFSGLHERTCDDNDFEDWCARTDEDGKCDCLMGHKQYYRRRKRNADCFIKEKVEDPTKRVKTEQCDCTDEDFECDFGFYLSEEQKCVPSSSLKIPEGKCKAAGDSFPASSGYRLIPGNDCNKMNGVKKDQPKDWPCDGSVQKPPSGIVTSEINVFDAKSISEKHYLESPIGIKAKDETIILRTSEQDIMITHDHGKSWEKILEGKSIVMIYPHPYNHNYVYFITPSKKVYYYRDRGLSKKHHSFEPPSKPSTHEASIMNFHAKHPDWIIWMGDKDCKRGSDDCHVVAEVSTDRGAEWHLLRRFVKKCQFMYHEQARDDKQKLIYCEQFENEEPDKALQLVTSDDFFDEDINIKFPDIRDFTRMSEFIVVAAEDREKDSLKVDCSVDGNIFADAQFPRNFQVDVQRAYTVLDSSTHSIFLHVTTNTLPEHEFGSIIKSNSNGTAYALSANYVNRNVAGFVDFEKTLGMEGTAVVNVVANPEEAIGGKPKKLKTKITHNDGAEWTFITPPEKSVQGKESGCTGKELAECSFHIHGYTERDDPTDTYSSPSAIGVMLAVGNVGEYLGPPGSGDTYISTDAGINWKPAMEGDYMWEFGDQGSVIVLVANKRATKVIYYTTDLGIEWNEWEFSTQRMEIYDITTVPSDMSMNFLLWGNKGGRGGQQITVNIDFSGLFDKQCVLDEKNPEAGDYDLWTPKHPSLGNRCLFGHVAKYHRKKPGRMCYNGDYEINGHIHDMEENCACERSDYECDYDYERKSDGNCRLVEGASKPDHEVMCKADPSLIEYFDPSGYRRIPLDTCQGGKEYDKSTESYPCPGHQKEFAEKHRIGGFALFCAIVIPIGVAAAAGYWVWRNWDGKFGRIRLGDTAGSETWEGALRVVVVIVAGTWSLVRETPNIVAKLWTWARGGSRRYTTRSSFQQARGEYEAVTRLEEEDVGGLLGDESDDDDA
ncbi:MAG: vacuolar protein sorting/targeting protein PEP1 [Vezdaea aestivalis]|nr:MAG: vacuolar protein sorting/targeting protein PEP1 [Vezdaea aestivalis]